MEFEETLVRTLTASEGHKLTQSGEVKITDRTLATMLMLSASDSPENWKEVTDEEAEALKTERENEIKRLAAEREKERKRAELEAQLRALDEDNSDAYDRPTDAATDAEEAEQTDTDTDITTEGATEEE